MRFFFLRYFINCLVKIDERKNFRFRLFTLFIRHEFWYLFLIGLDIWEDVFVAWSWVWDHEWFDVFLCHFLTDLAIKAIVRNFGFTEDVGDSLVDFLPLTLVSEFMRNVHNKYSTANFLFNSVFDISTLSLIFPSKRVIYCYWHIFK